MSGARRRHALPGRRRVSRVRSTRPGATRSRPRTGSLARTVARSLYESLQLGPRFERVLLLAPPDRVVDADLGRVDVDHSPGDRPVEHLAERLRCLEAVAG